ncbi:MAG: Rid family hydrolase [Gammaproteobacteria bacterium]
MRSLIYIGALLALAACESDDDTEFVFERINPETLNRHPAYSQVTTITGETKFIYVAGQTDRGLDYTPGSNACQHDDWRGQIIGVNENVERGLQAAGATWDDVVFIRRFVLDMAAYRAVLFDRDNSIPSVWENRDPPPSTLIEIGALSEPCQLLEVDVFAAVSADE